jgi:hypothetical protein
MSKKNKAKTVTIPLKGGSQKVPRLTPRHMITLGDKIYDEQRSQLLKDLEDAGCCSSERRDSLSTMKRGVVGSLLDYVWTMRGALEVISVAIDKDTDDVSEEIEATFDEIIGLAVDLLGYKVETTEGAEDSNDAKKK